MLVITRKCPHRDIDHKLGPNSAISLVLKILFSVFHLLQEITVRKTVRGSTELTEW